MSIRQALLTKLLSLESVTEICEGRVYWVRMIKQDDFPCVVFQVNGGSPIDGGDHDGCGPITAMRISVEVVAFSRDQAEAIALAEGIQQASPDGINGASWVDGSLAVQLVSVTEILADDYEDPPFSSYSCGFVMEVNYGSVS